MTSGTSAISARVQARCVASRSAGIGREVAWKCGAILPSDSSFAVKWRMMS